MTETDRYIQILIDSLKKKIEILDTMLVLNERQSEAVKKQDNLDEFDQIVDLKSEQIRLLEKLDTGFETIYKHVRPEFTERAHEHREQIREIQSLISQITERSVKVETTENRNKQAIEQYFSLARKNLHESRKSVNAASDYYKSMSGMQQYADPQMINFKQ